MPLNTNAWRTYETQTLTQHQIVAVRAWVTIRGPHTNARRGPLPYVSPMHFERATNIITVV